MKSPGRGLILLVLLVIFSGCQQKVLFEETKNLPLSGWSQDNYLNFKFPCEDIENQYRISLIIRNTAKYKYSNLFLFVNTTAPGGRGIRDTIEIRMADERGRWFGKGIGGKYTLEVPFKTNVVFPEPGNYGIEIEQGMREEELKFITDVGLRITKMK